MEPEKKVAKPVEAPLEAQVIITKNAEEFAEWVLSLPPGTKQTPEGRAKVLKALEKEYSLGNSETSS